MRCRPASWAADEVGDPGPVGVEAVELEAAPEQQSLADDALEMACWLSMAPFSCATPVLLRVGVIP